MTRFEGWALAGVAVLALAKGLLWSSVIPPWYGPDEASHYEYVQLMVVNHALPRGPDANAAVDYPHDLLCSEANLDLGVYGAFHAEPPFDSASLCVSHDAGATGPLNAAAGYTPVYYAAGIPFYAAVYLHTVEDRLHAVRLWSVLLGVLASVFAFLGARVAFAGNRALAVAASVLFTLQPMNSQQTAIVNNDALLIAVAAAFWWAFFHAVRNGVSGRAALVLGTLVGVAYLAKPQGLFLAAALPILVPATRRIALALLATAVPIVIALGLGYAFSKLAGNSGALIPSSPGVHGLQQYIQLYTAGHFERLYLVWITSFWGYFGWFQVDLPSVAYVVIALAIAAAVVAAVWALRKPGPERRVLVAAMLAFLIPAAILQLLEVYTFRSSGDLILQGRSFLMLLVPVVVVLVWGCRQLLGSFAAGCVVLAAVVLNLVSLFAMMEGFYG